MSTACAGRVSKKRTGLRYEKADLSQGAWFAPQRIALVSGFNQAADAECVVEGTPA